MSDRDILVKLTIQDNGTVALSRVAKAADVTEKQLEQAGAAGAAAGKGIAAGAAIGSAGVKSLGAALGTMLAPLVAIGAAVRALTAIGGFLLGSVKDGIAAAQVVTNLTGALATLGIAYKDVAGDLQRMAKTMQATTKYGDEEALGAFQNLLNITGDYGAALKLMQGTADLAAAKQMDLASAAELVGKAGAGVTATLSRYGIVLDDNTRKQIENADAMGRAEIVAKLLEDKFGGQAQAQMAGFGNQLTQMGNYFGDLREEIGQLFMDMGEGGNMLAPLTAIFQWMTEKVADLRKALSEFAEGNLFKALASDLSALGDIAKRVWELFGPVLAGYLETAAKLLGGALLIALKAVTVELDALVWILDKVVGAFEAFDDAAIGLGFDTKLNAYTESLKGTGRETNKAAEAQKNLSEWVSKGAGFVNANKKALDGYVKSAVDTTAAQKEMREEFKRLWTAAADALDWAIKNVKALAEEGDRLIEESMGWVEDVAGQITTSDQQLASAIEQTTRGLLDTAGAAINDFAGESAGAVDGAALQMQAALANAQTNARTWSDEFKGIIGGTFADGIGEILTGNLDSLEDVFRSAFETLAEAAADVFGKVFTDAMSDTSGAGFLTSLRENFMAELRENPEAFALGGAGSVYSATQRQNRGAAAVQGALGGAMTGLGIASMANLLPAAGLGPAGWIAIGIGAIVGGALAYFGSGSGESPWMSANVGPDGVLVTDSGGHAGMDAERRNAWEEKIRAAYSGLQNQFRSALEMLDDPELFNLLGDDPTWSGEGNPQDLAQILVENILPDAFQEQFAGAFRQGLMNLGMTAERFDELSDVMSNLPGQERLALLTNYINVIKNLNELMEVSGDIRGAAMESPWESWAGGFEGVMDQVAVFRAGWEDLDLSQQVAQGQKTVDLLSVWYQNAVDYMRSLIQMQESMQNSIDSMRERLTLRGMTEGEQGQYALAGYQEQLRLLQGATDPRDAQRYFEEAMRFLEMLEGNPLLDRMGEMRGFEFGEDWLLSLLTPLETAMNEAMGGFQDTIQAQADALYEELQTMFENLTGANGGVGALDSEAAGASSSVRDLGQAAADAAGAFVQIGEGLEDFAERMENLMRHMASASRVNLRDAGVAAM
jgi:hypothetical protein